MKSTITFIACISLLISIVYINNTFACKDHHCDVSWYNCGRWVCDHWDPIQGIKCAHSGYAYCSGKTGDSNRNCWHNCYSCASFTTCFCPLYACYCNYIPDWEDGGNDGGSGDEPKAPVQME